MEDTQSAIDSLGKSNSKFFLQISELRKENADIKAENIKLKQDKAENAKQSKIEITRLEKENDKNKLGKNIIPDHEVKDISHATVSRHESNAMEPEKLNDTIKDDSTETLDFAERVASKVIADDSSINQDQTGENTYISIQDSLSTIQARKPLKIKTENKSIKEASRNKIAVTIFCIMRT
ncbi:hypothetical protein Glove_5g78 [Diversispora epigaea]|uniref:Uncharacterized protein n=1 Tax=Diversispora epigaea TaxID=1348612 RepID=A0A397JZ99_9GLOM|nr:hypothetical protein Glove_5g78 [Diversispora epigaea]